MDWASDFLFGESSESLLPQALIDSKAFSVAVEKSLKGVTRRVMLSPILKFLPKDQRWHAAFTEVNEYFDHHIKKALEGYYEKSSLSRPVSPDQLDTDDHFVLLHELVKESQDHEFLRDQLVSIFMPAYQALPIGLAGIFFQIARAPHVWVKLRAEALALGEVPLTFEVLKSMQYLQCVIKEGESSFTLPIEFVVFAILNDCIGLRLIAPLDRIVRLCTDDCVLPHGGGALGEDRIFIRQGTLIDLRVNILHRNLNFWGPHANEFQPERWMNTSLQSRWEYLPFGGGMRNCPAHQMTTTQIAYIITRLVQRFEAIENRDPVLEFVDEYTFSKRSRNGVQIALKPAYI